MSGENAEQEYSVYFRNFLSREDASAGYIDPSERRNLRLKRIRLGISEESANRIEMTELDAVYPKFSTELVIPEEKTDFFSPVLKDDLKIYAKLNLYNSIKIIKVFSEGKTSAQVFEAECRREGQKRPEYKLLKYDYYPKILKEYLPSIDEITKDVYDKNNVTAIENQMPVGKDRNGFLELKAFYRKAEVERVFSFKTLLSDMRRFDSDYDFILEDQSKTQALLNAIIEIFTFLFRQLYINPEKPLAFHSEPMQNSVEFFLPPRKMLSAKLKKKSDKSLLEGFRKISQSDIFGFDVKPHETDRNLGVLSIKFGTKFSSADSLTYRLDSKVVLSYDELISYQNKPDEWDIYVNPKEFVEQKSSRENIFKTVSEKIKIPESVLADKNFMYFFQKINTKNYSLDTGYSIDAVLKENALVCQTESLHGDLNASNILYGIGSVGGQISTAVIDLYDINTKGNIFFDAARYETDIFLRTVQRYLKKYHKELIEKKEFSLEDQMFILNLIDRLEDSAYTKKAAGTNQNNDSFFLYPDGDKPVFCINILNIILQIFPKLNIVKDPAVKWTVEDIRKSFYLCMAVYSLKFSIFPKEEEAVKTAAVFLSMRYFSRLKDMSGTANGQTPVSDLAIPETSSLSDLCKKSNYRSRTDVISPELFTDFYKEGISEQIWKFYKTDDKIFFINGEIGSGKSVFLDFLTEEGQYTVPTLKISGKIELKDKYSLIDEIRDRLRIDKTESLPVKIGKMMKSSDKFFLVIIDEIYYNSNQNLASQCLRQLFWETLSDGRFKFIISVIPAYWSGLIVNEHLKDIISEKAMSFDVPQTEKNSKYVSDSSVRFFKFTAPEKYWDEIVLKYFKYYSIKGRLKPSALRILSTEIWILKLFCEVKRGSNVGELEHIYFVDVLDQCVNSYHHKIASSGGISPEKVSELFHSVSLEMENRNCSELDEKEFFDIVRKADPESKPDFILMNAVSIGYLKNHKQKISFRFTMSSPAYYIAEYACRNWEKYSNTSTEEHRWLLKKVETARSVQFSELVLFHIAGILGKMESQEDFTAFFDILLKKFIEYKAVYPVLRIFGKSVSFLPNFNASTNSLVQKLERQCAAFKQKYVRDLRFEREFGTCFSMLENNLAVLRNRQWVHYMNSFDRSIRDNNFKPLVLEISGKSFNWRDFKHFLTEDSRRNGNFIRNQLASVMRGLTENFLNLENAIVNVCENLLNAAESESRLDDFTQLNMEIYEALFKCLQISDEVHDSSGREEKIFRLITKKRINNEKVFEFTANRLHVECESKKTPSYWVQFLLTSLDSDKDSSIHSMCFQYLVETMYRFRNLNMKSQKLILDSVFNDDLTVSEKFLAKERLTLLKILYDALPDIYSKHKKNLETAVSEYPVYQKQEVYFVMIRKGDLFLLRYNAKWGDYNWIADRLDSGTAKKTIPEISEIIIESLEEKLKVSRKKFKLEILTVAKGAYLIKSKRDDRELKEYYPIICTLQAENVELFETLQSDPKHRFFHISDLTKPINPEVSPAVKMIISKILSKEGILQRIPDVIK